MKRKTHPLIVLPVILLSILLCISLTITITYFYSSVLNILGITKSSTTSHDLSQEEYTKLSHTLSEIVRKSSPREALDELIKNMNKDERVYNACHSLVHELGQTAYKKYGDIAQALSYQEDICGSGYLHGVIEQHFEGSTDILSSLQTVCGGYTSKIEGKCLHGVGHGLMYYTNNDLPRSLEMCSSYANTSAKIFCSEGVFMENFNSEERFHTSKYLKPSDPFYPCSQQSSLYKDSCYFYAPDYYLKLNKRQYVPALRWCEHAEQNYVFRCITGVGSRAIKQNLQNIPFVEAVCMRGKSVDQINACIDGMVSYHLVNYNSTTKTEKMCYTLHQQNKAVCISSLNNRKYLFDR